MLTWTPSTPLTGRMLQQFLVELAVYKVVRASLKVGISARDAEAGMLAGLSSRRSAIPQHAPALQLAGADGGQTNVRILNLLDKRQLVGGHLRSAEGTRDVLNIISENSDEIGRRIRVR
jgi:hypothetical protein